MTRRPTHSTASLAPRTRAATDRGPHQRAARDPHRQRPSVSARRPALPRARHISLSWSTAAGRACDRLPPSPCVRRASALVDLCLRSAPALFSTALRLKVVVARSGTSPPRRAASPAPPPLRARLSHSSLSLYSPVSDHVQLPQRSTECNLLLVLPSLCCHRAWGAVIDRSLAHFCWLPMHALPAAPRRSITFLEPVSCISFCCPHLTCSSASRPHMTMLTAPRPLQPGPAVTFAPSFPALGHSLHPFPRRCGDRSCLLPSPPPICFL